MRVAKPDSSPAFAFAFAVKRVIILLTNQFLLYGNFTILKINDPKERELKFAHGLKGKGKRLGEEEEGYRKDRNEYVRGASNPITAQPFNPTLGTGRKKSGIRNHPETRISNRIRYIRYRYRETRPDIQSDAAIALTSLIRANFRRRFLTDETAKFGSPKRDGCS